MDYTEMINEAQSFKEDLMNAVAEGHDHKWMTLAHDADAFRSFIHNYWIDIDKGSLGYCKTYHEALIAALRQVEVKA